MSSIRESTELLIFGRNASETGGNAAEPPTIPNTIAGIIMGVAVIGALGSIVDAMLTGGGFDGGPCPFCFGSGRWITVHDSAGNGRMELPCPICRGDGHLGVA